MKNVKAQIIGETSAGMIAVQIYENGKLVWSHDYFSNGATGSQYEKYMRQAREDAEGCADWRDYDDNGCDESVGICDYRRCDTNWVVAEFSDGKWKEGDAIRNDGMSEDFLRRNTDIAKVVGYRF